MKEYDAYALPLEGNVICDSYELQTPVEAVTPVEKEFDAPAEYTMPAAPEISPPGTEDGIQRYTRKKHSRLLFLAAGMTAVVTIMASSGTHGTQESELPAETAAAEAYGDEKFPNLSNLEPNGTIPGYGVLNEEYIVINSGEAEQYIVAGSRLTNEFGVETAEVSGISYDLETNTLTLDNFTGEVLNVNLMGNSFTIQLAGDNNLDKLIVWGFGYGGSVRITGNGSLTVNKSMDNDVGIELVAEYSQTCLMIDREATLDIYGKRMGIYIYDTTMEKAIYYLKPLKLTGGERMSTAYENTPDLFAHTIADENGVPARHITFSPQ